ncbi:MAG: cysteine desulfurase DndA [Acidiferrobacterales bacterium]|nr:cysteine desulfurase DndA [Acidiferrobacterales bacterium]
MTIYLDTAATTPLDRRVFEIMRFYLMEEYGNSGSRTHEYGMRAKSAVQKARTQIADVVESDPLEVVFTSGATESNNLAILGLEEYLRESGRKHIITSAIEHKSVLAPVQILNNRGFDVDFLPVCRRGVVNIDSINNSLREDTGLVSIMHVNNETGVQQPIKTITEALRDHEAYFHVDAAQGFGKVINTLKSNRIDLLSISGHKIFGPKGIGALITRRRGYKLPPLKPLLFGGGQELGLRPGTLPVPLIAGLGLAAELASYEHAERQQDCSKIKDRVYEAFSDLNPKTNGDQSLALPHILNVSFPGLDAEAVMVALKGVAAISNGSACTSSSYKPSHVLNAMGLDDNRISGAVRISWFHDIPNVDWDAIANQFRLLR